MKVLFLDDDPYRWKIARRRMPEATWAETAAACIEALSASEWDLVYLDHDLGGEVYVDSLRADTGMEVVRWLVANGTPARARKIVVHSMNPVSILMVEALRDAGFVAEEQPFLDLEFAWCREEK